MFGATLTTMDVLTEPLSVNVDTMPSPLRSPLAVAVKQSPALPVPGSV